MKQIEPMMRRLCTVAVCGALAFSVSACGGDDASVITSSTGTNTGTTVTTAPAAETLKDVVYAGTSAAQKMDVYIPEGAGPFPAVVLIHGGAFKIGDKGMDASNAATLVANGYVAVAINYRLSGEAKFPAAVHDAKAAVRFVRANAAKYRINPDKIGSWGASAGGNLAAILGTSGGDAYLEGTQGDYVGTSSRVQATIDWFGPINFATMVQEGLALGFASTYNVDNESAYMGVDANDPVNNALMQKANPTSYIDAQDPPFWIQVGGADPLIPYTQSLNFYNALKAVLGESKIGYEKLEGAGHGGAQFSTSANLDKAIAFFNKNLK